MVIVGFQGECKLAMGRVQSRELRGLRQVLCRCLRPTDAVILGVEGQRDIRKQRVRLGLDPAQRVHRRNALLANKGSRITLPLLGFTADRRSFKKGCGNPTKSHKTSSERAKLFNSLPFINPVERTR